MGYKIESKKLIAQDIIEFSKEDLIDISKYEKKKIQEERLKELGERLKKPLFLGKKRKSKAKGMGVSPQAGIRGFWR